MSFCDFGGKNINFGGNLEFLRFAKNAQGLVSGINRIWNQHPQIDKKPSKNVVYIQKQGHVVSSPD